MKILFYSSLIYMDVQKEIHKAFVYYVCKMAKRHECIFLIDQRKKARLYREHGLVSKLEDAGVEIIDLYYTDAYEVNKGNNQDTKLNDTFFETLKGIKPDCLFLYSLSTQITKSLVGKYIGMINGDEVKVTFVSNRAKIFPYMVTGYLDKVNKGLKVRQFIVDPLEENVGDVIKLVNDVKYFADYPIEDRGVKQLSLSAKYHYRNFGNKYGTKTKLFVYGFTVTYTTRQWLHDWVEKNIKQDDDFVVYERHKKAGIDNSIPQDEYLKIIEQAKFSMVTKSNNQDEFSIIRFHECVSRKCIPIILAGSNFEKAFANNQEVVELWEECGLFYNGEIPFNDYIRALDYDGIMEKISLSKYFKELV